MEVKRKMPKSANFKRGSVANPDNFYVISNYSNPDEFKQLGTIKKSGDSSYVNGKKTSSYVEREALLPIGTQLSTIEAGKVTDNAALFNAHGTDEHEFADFYVGWEYKEFNNAVVKAMETGDFGSLSKHQAKMYKIMMNSSRPLLKDATLYRFSTGDTLNKQGFDWDNPSNFIGKTVPINKALSTAHNVANGTDYFSGRQVFTITLAPAGTMVNNLSQYNSSEREIVITPTGSQFARVINAYNVPGLYGKAGYTVLIQKIEQIKKK